MWTPLFLALFLGCAISFYVVHRRQREEIRALERAREKLQAEETRVFDFLHGLGAAFSEEIRASDLHRLIVDGAMKILDAHGGALYLLDREGRSLVPTFISKGCPPLIEVPAHVVQQAETTPVALQSYIRLHAVAPGEGPVGAAWKGRVPLLLSEEDVRLSGLRDTTSRTGSAMLCPLVFANQNVGVLALANGPMSTSFTSTDLATFAAIAEQSAFALYNAIVYSEANEKKRLDLDLQVAQDIQRILLPSNSPRIEGYEISGINIPASHVSGDYFDYIRVDEERYGVAIADVSGKGVPASLIMAMCRTVLRSKAVGNASAAAVLHRVNAQLFPDIKQDMFISLAYLILDPRTDQVTLCRAGHDAPLLYSAKSQTVSKLNPPGMALGIDSGDVFNRITGDFSVTLEQGDCLILYTDGVTEAQDAEGAEYGMKRMIHSIQKSAVEGAGGMIRQLTEDVRKFVGSHPQGDDITLIVIRKT